ncbi:hypothetical protein HHI36_004667 [Cryptolaemus montrouzieri]|uniref:Fibronectin type-III domain-containing protein n=1 Tax=Cryptolaemus montrouzieri TaxID=559131 RepID=A0ABD2NRV5_9CUCU
MYRVIILAVIVGSIETNENADIKNLVGEPDYRQVRLHWETDKASGPQNFQVRYCELQTWGPQRCRAQIVPEQSLNDIEYDDSNVKSYNTNIKGLRMATTYSFEIRNEMEIRDREDRSQGIGRNQNIIVIPTKGCK